MKNTSEDAITPSQLFDESFSSTVSTSGDDDEDESPLVGMAKLMKKKKRESKKESKKKDKKSKKSSSKRSSSKKIYQDDSSEALDVTESSLVEEDSPGKLKDLKAKWEQRSPQVMKHSFDPGHSNVRNQRDLWEHRMTEKTKAESPKSSLVSRPIDKYSSYTSKVKSGKEATNISEPDPLKRNEFNDALISFIFAAFLIGIAMLIHQPYGPFLENITMSRLNILPDWDTIVHFARNCTEPTKDWLQQWSNLICSTLFQNLPAADGSKIVKVTNNSGDIRHFLLL